MRRRIGHILQRLDVPDPGILLFLLLFVQVKLLVKVAGLIFLYIVNRASARRFFPRRIAMPLFYPMICLVALVNVVWYGLFRDAHYLLVFVTGTGFWLICLLAFLGIATRLSLVPAEKIHSAIRWFLIINCMISVVQLLLIILETGAINPYRFQGNYQKYFIGTGDYIKGVSFDTSTCNAILNAFSVVYCLFRKQLALSILCMSVLLLACSNSTNLLLAVCLAGIFFLQRDRHIRSIIVVQLAMLIAFMANISPQNNTYAINAIAKLTGNNKPGIQQTANPGNKPDSLLTDEERKYRAAQRYLDSASAALQQDGIKQPMAAAIVVPRVNIHAPEYQHRPDSSAARLQAIAMYRALPAKPADTVVRVKKYAGKIVGWMELYRFLEAHPARWLTGNGMGNYSSKLAFRVAGLKAAGGYPAKYQYVHPDFRNGFLEIYLEYFVRDSGFHSVINTPNSVYTQLLGEYGLTGFLLFVFFYLGYFIRRSPRTGYAWPLLFLLAGVFFTDYWFEQLSVVPVFELLMLLTIKSRGNEPVS